MSVSIFGILTILYVILVPVNGLYFRRKPIEQIYSKLFFVSVLFSLVFDVGYVAQISGFVVEYNYLFSIVNLLFAIPVIARHRINNNFSILFVIFAVIITFNTLFVFLLKIGYVSCPHEVVWDHYFGSNSSLPVVYVSKSSFFIICRIIIFLVSFYAFALTLTKDRILIFSKIIYKVSIIVIVASFIEIFVSSFIDPYVIRKLAYRIFGHSSSTYDISKHIWKIYSPMLFMREPSTYAHSLFFFGINNIFYLQCKSQPDSGLPKLILCAIGVLLLISFSMSALLYFAVLAFLLLYCFGNKKAIPIAILGIGLIAVAVELMYSNRINNIFSYILQFGVSEPKDLPVSSELIRLYSIYNNLVLFVKNPLFGCGVGSIYSFSGVVTLFANIGIIGVVLYSALINNVTNEIFGVKRFAWLTLLTVFMAFSLTGHMSYILYNERIGYLFILVKGMQLAKESKVAVAKTVPNKVAVYEEV